MNKKVKIGLGAFVLLLGAGVLSGCTASFCSVTDQAHVLYAYDPGVTTYYKSIDAPEGAKDLKIYNYDDKTEYVVAGVKWTSSFNNSQALKATAYTISNNGLVGPKWNGDQKTGSVDDSDARTNTLKVYYEYFDNNVLVKMLKAKYTAEGKTFNFANVDINDIFDLTYETKNYVYQNLTIWDIYGDLKFTNKTAAKQVLWTDSYDVIAKEVTNRVLETPGMGSLDFCPSTDFISSYKSTMNTYASSNSFRSCLTTSTGFYGSYSNSKNTVLMEPKDYGYAWSKGFFEGLLVWPIGAFIDVLGNAFGYNDTLLRSQGIPQLLAILVVTFVIRGIMLLATFKSTTANAKMTNLQPEITKIQNKYPNANTNTYDKQRMAQEMQALYKKNKINPFSTILVLIVQFPVFICVWGALSGSAMLTTGKFLGLDLGASISSVLFTGVNWTAEGQYGAVTALFLFLLMAASQTLSMLLPQWIQKRKVKQVAKLGKNPAQKSSNNKMKWFTYIMLAMIIVMGFSLVSAMGVYWFVGAIFSIIQTLVTQAIQNRKERQKRYN